MLSSEIDKWQYNNTNDSILKKVCIYIILLIFFSQILFAQSEKKKFFPTSAVGLQFFGSVGWLSVGYFRQTANKKLELGFTYGYIPEFAGGRIHTLALKFIYEPFRINIKPHFQFEPLQTGVFISKSFGKNLHFSWPDKFVGGYYWWPNSILAHIFLSMQASYVLNDRFVQKITFYFETNTNDLYVISYIDNNNRSSLHFTNIFFFGFGSKVYF